jgi:23S rRNA pseudouridine1911/1915/1917 synthase
MEPTVIYEDEYLLAINKPAGMMTHPDAQTDTGTVSDWFAARYPESAEVGEPQTLPNGRTIMRPGIVHRLDRDTSGVLLLVKTQEAHAYLKAAFQERRVHKTYLAIVYGTLPEKQGVIDMPIGRSSKDFRLRSAQRGAKGKLRDAVTRWEQVSDIGTHALLKAFPETGRTHQIRVHLKAVHHPIVCDPLYAPNHPCELGLSRVGLHAYTIEFPHPNGETRSFSAPVPEDMRVAVGKFPQGETFLKG